MKYILEEKLEVCPYCMNERDDRFSCCGEVHFETAYAFENLSYYVLEHELTNEMTQAICPIILKKETL